MESDDQTHDTQSYMCFPLSLIDKKTHLEAGSNIIMPASALSSKSQKLVCRMTFRVAKSNDTSTLHYHCGVAEFTADDGFAFLPTWMMKKLNIREGDLVNIKDTSLPEGNYIKVQPRTTKFFTLSDHELVLKKALRDNVACLTTGDNIVVNHDDKKYLFHIVETKPSFVVSLFENDSYEVEFAIPLDYYKRPWLDLFRQWNGAILQGYDTIYQSRKKLMVKESTVANKQQAEFNPFTRKIQRAIINMPDEIIQNILGRLPKKPLLRSRCVSAHWNRLVSDPYFMKAKLRRKILLVAPDFHAIEDNGPCGDDTVKLHYPFERRTDGGVRNIRIIGTFNGIVALAVNDDKDVGSKSKNVLGKKPENFTSHIILYNPFTRASEIIPDPYSPLYNSECRYGFGYGATKDELKIVRFRNFKGRNDNCYTCDVFNLKERSWSTSDILMKDTEFLSDVGTFLNGYLYWLAYEKIVALDVNEMVISEIHLPCEHIYSHTVHLGTLHGCLSMITRVGHHDNNHLLTEKFDMWVMKTEQGVKNSWSKSPSLTLSLEYKYYLGVKIINLMDDGRILMMTQRKELIIYDTSKNSHKFLKSSPSDIDYYHINATEYEESLISPFII